MTAHPANLDFRLLTSGALLALALASPALPAGAVDWVMLQGTEPAKAPAVRPFGFVGIQYQSNAGSRLPTGPWAGQPLVLNQVPPLLEESSTLQFSHVRLGLRGRLFDGKLNYWVSPLAGDNGISANGTPNVKFTDLSVTLNLIPHARVRIGQFKHPGSEEGMTPAVLQHYVNPTAVGGQMLNERPLDSDGLSPLDANALTGPMSGWRDTGVQLFDAFSTGDWVHTYALMAGTGTGLALYNGMGEGRPDWYLYWASEWVFGGKGMQREGLKLSLWYQDGERRLAAGPEQREQDFDRTRYGLGATYRRGPWRAAAEWIAAEGMIFNGTDAVAVPGSMSNNGRLIASYNVLPEDSANGWYLDLGYTLFDALELRGRWDRLDRGTDTDLGERRFDTLTLGVTYTLSPHVRVLADYQLRDFEAPRLAGSAMPNEILDDVDDLFAAQVWVKF